MSHESEIATKVKKALAAYANAIASHPNSVSQERRKEIARECGAPEDFLGLVILAGCPRVYGYAGLDLWAETD